MIKKINDSIIDDLLKSEKTFIILFYSDSISNIQNILNVFEKFDTQFNGKIDIYHCKIDEEYGKISNYFRMNVLPAMIMMKNNIPYANIAGPVSTLIYEDAIKKGIINIMKDAKIIKSSAFSN